MKIILDNKELKLTPEQQRDIKKLLNIIEVNPMEIAILQALDPIYKYIARDYDGDLYVYEDKPIKSEHYTWVCNRNFAPFNTFNETLFSYITWSDKEPYAIKDIIEYGRV